MTGGGLVAELIADRPTSQVAIDGAGTFTVRAPTGAALREYYAAADSAPRHETMARLFAISIDGLADRPTDAGIEAAFELIAAIRRRQQRPDGLTDLTAAVLDLAGLGRTADGEAVDEDPPPPTSMP